MLSRNDCRFIIIAINGWLFKCKGYFIYYLSAFLLVNFGKSLSSIIHYFLSTQGQMSAVGTLVSSVCGFIFGAYMPTSQFGDTLQNY